MKKILKVVNSLLFIFFVCFMVFMLISSYDTMNPSRILQVLCILPLVMVPYILAKLKIYKMDETLLFFYYVFILLALVLGSILRFYDKVWWFDLFTHFMSGIMTSIVAFIFLKEYKVITKKNKFFCILFILSFTIAIAGCWEYFEFACDKISGGDVQFVAETGVGDTMTDMLIATLGGILSSIYYLYYIHKK